MHERPPSEPEGEYLPPNRPAPERPGWKSAGGAVVGFGLLAAKFKGLLFVLFSFKWLLFAPKLLLSFGSLIASVWLYALFFGWKFGIVFVLLILVHELGHYVTFRNFGVPVSLPYFIPGLGAFVAARPQPSLIIDVIATIAGPLFGIAASGVCWWYGVSTHEPFWLAAAYVGFFLNALNLIPIPPFDGGTIAGAIDSRLWILGAVAFIGYLIVYAAWTPFTILFVLLIAIGAIPRLRAMWRGEVDPRAAALGPRTRITIALMYFATIALATAGAAATHISTATRLAS